jgi:hypothetical protein
MIKQKKTKKKNVNVNQTVVVNIQKGKRNPRAKASAPQMMSAPQIIPPQVGSAYHQAVYGARAPAIPSMGNIAGYYGGMMSPFNAPLHVVSEVQQAQLRQANELAGANLQRPMERLGQSPSLLRPMVAERVPVPSVERMPERIPPPEKPKPIRMSFYPGSYEELPFASSISVPEDRPNLSVPAISFSKPSAPLSMEAPEPVESVKRKPEIGDNEPEPARRPRGRPEIGEPNYGGVVAWIDRQVVKQGNSPIGISKDTFIEQLSGQIGQQFTVGNIKNKSFDEIKRRAKKFINDIIQAGR